jgi:crossover junction endodeoxyribonuclease RuvC
MILGIDIGATGALAFLDPDGRLIAVHDMPCLADGTKGRKTLNTPLFAGNVFNSHARQAFVEYVGVRPGEGAVGAFAVGRSKGVVEGVLSACGLPVVFLTPPNWKRIIGIPMGKDGAKDAARSNAIRRWPAKADLFARVKDDGRAEAALIGLAGLMREWRNQ